MPNHSCFCSACWLDDLVDVVLFLICFKGMEYKKPCRPGKKCLIPCKLSQISLQQGRIYQHCLCISLSKIKYIPSHSKNFRQRACQFCPFFPGMVNQKENRFTHNLLTTYPLILYTFVMHKPFPYFTSPICFISFLKEDTVKWMPLCLLFNTAILRFVSYANPTCLLPNPTHSSDTQSTGFEDN